MKEESDLEAVFGKRLREMREARDLTQAEVVKWLSSNGLPYMNTSTLSRIELGARPVRLGEATIFARFYDIPMEALVTTSLSYQSIEKASRLHEQARSKYVLFRNAVVDVIHQQQYLSQWIELFDEVLEQEPPDSELIKPANLLKKNYQHYLTIDLVKETKQLVEEMSQRFEQGNESTAGRFLNRRSHRG